MTTLYELTKEFKRIAYNLEQIEDITPEIISDTLEGFKGDFEDKVKNIARYINGLMHDIDSIKSEENRLAERRKRIEKSIDNIKKYTLFNMQAIGVDNISDNIFTIKVNPGRESVIIDDDSALKPEYLRHKESYEPDKKLIMQAIKDGYQVSGARLERKPYLEFKN